MYNEVYLCEPLKGLTFHPYHSRRHTHLTGGRNFHQFFSTYTFLHISGSSLIKIVLKISYVTLIGGTGISSIEKTRLT